MILRMFSNVSKISKDQMTLFTMDDQDSDFLVYRLTDPAARKSLRECKYFRVSLTAYPPDPEKKERHLKLL
jgi:hypothetical protein